MKILLFIAGFYLLGSIGTKNKEDKTVYYCDSPNGIKYHFTKECRGLKKCTHTIKKTTEAGAKKLELTVCLIEK